MTDNQNICSNCGAPMQQHSFTYECDYCGSIVLKEGLSEIMNDDSETSIEDKYNYINKNYSYISQFKFLVCSKTEDIFEIKTTTPFYANDGHYNKILDFCFSLYYDNNRETDNLYLYVQTHKKSANPQLSIIIDGESYVRPLFAMTENECIVFNISRKELQLICEAHIIFVASNCFDTDGAIFSELSSYCSRFYHSIFDKRKYIYSLHKNLLTDK